MALIKWCTTQASNWRLCRLLLLFIDPTFVRWTFTTDSHWICTIQSTWGTSKCTCHGANCLWSNCDWRRWCHIRKNNAPSNQPTTRGNPNRQYTHSRDVSIGVDARIIHLLTGRNPTGKQRVLCRGSIRKIPSPIKTTHQSFNKPNYTENYLT